MKTNINYTEANELFLKPENVDTQNKNETGAVLLTGIVNSFTPTTVLVLETLTGLDLDSKEKLYDYLSSTIELTDEFLAGAALCQLAESVGKNVKNVDELITKLKSEVASEG